MSANPPATEAAAAGVIGKRQKGVEERRLRLIKAASELIAERDDGTFSMQELAQRAGLSLATPYNLLGSKAAVLACVFARLVRGFHRDTDWLAGLSADARILGVIDRLIVAYEQQGRLFRNLWKALYGLDLSEHRQMNLSLSNEIVGPLVASLVQDKLLPGTIAPEVVETTLVRVFDANFEQWASQGWSPALLRANLRASFSLVFLGLVSPAERIRLEAAIAEAATVFA